MFRYGKACSHAVRLSSSRITSELPDIRILGNYDAVYPAGRVRFTERVNALIADEVRQRPYLVLNDVCYLSARIGLDNWYDDPARWFKLYKLATTPQASAELAFNLAALICARYGLSKKVLVLDLDNTLWGGVIGDDGTDAIVIGRETPRAEAYTHFQEYVRRLRQRGTLCWLGGFKKRRRLPLAKVSRIPISVAGRSATSQASRPIGNPSTKTSRILLTNSVLAWTVLSSLTTIPRRDRWWPRSCPPSP